MSSGRRDEQRDELHQDCHHQERQSLPGRRKHHRLRSPPQGWFWWTSTHAVTCN